MRSDLPREYLPTQRSLGTNNMPWESCRRSAANTGCRYQSQHIVGLLRNACEAGTTLRWKDAVISVVSISQRAADPNICAHAKELYTFILPPMSCLPTPWLGRLGKEPVVEVGGWGAERMWRIYDMLPAASLGFSLPLGDRCSHPLCLFITQTHNNIQLLPPAS